MKPTNVIKLTLVMLIWALSWIFIKNALEELSPYSLAFLRFLVASPILLIIMLATKKEHMQINLSEIPIYITLSLTGVTLLYALEFTALKYTTTINASLLVNLSVIFIALFSFFFLHEKLKIKEWFGIFISFVGVFLIVSKGSFTFLNEKTFFGDILMIITAFLWMIYSIVGKKFLEKKDPLVVTTYTLISGTLLLIPFYFYDSFPIFEISITSWISIFYLAIFCSVFAYIFWFQAIKEETASKVAVFLYLIPLFTAIFSEIFLKEGITLFIIVGGILVIYGVHLTESK